MLDIWHILPNNFLEVEFKWKYLHSIKFHKQQQMLRKKGNVTKTRQNYSKVLILCMSGQWQFLFPYLSTSSSTNQYQPTHRAEIKLKQVWKLVFHSLIAKVYRISNQTNCAPLCAAIDFIMGILNKIRCMPSVKLKVCATSTKVLH